MIDQSKLSPMMKQYFEIKEKASDCILFFRMGDFYEMFFDDALLVSKEIEIALTARNCGLEEKAPMCGVPFHSATVYIKKILEKGHKIAICEQVEDPKLAKGLVKRDIIKIITPGTIMDSDFLKENEYNFLVSVYEKSGNFGVSYSDISTGETYCVEIAGIENFKDFISSISPKEVIVNLESKEYFLFLEEELKFTVSYINNSYFSFENSKKHILNQFKIDSLLGLGLENNNLCINSLGGLLGYLLETQKTILKQIYKLNIHTATSFMPLDSSTISSLELLESLMDRKLEGSLLSVLDKTYTAIGGRTLKLWLLRPLKNKNLIEKRLKAVLRLYEDPMLLNDIRQNLKGIYDFQRLTGKIGAGNANARDLMALKNSLLPLPELKNLLKDISSELINEIEESIIDFADLTKMIETSIDEEPPILVKEGGIIKEGYSEELDELKASISEGQSWIASLENIEREKTGINNLKVKYNKVFGYFIEITKSNYDKIPENYIRKQTLVNCERFITPELKDVESLVLNAQGKINKLEYEIFKSIIKKVQEYTTDLLITSEAIGVIDVIASFAKISIENNYVMPEINEYSKIILEESRHPVVEKKLRNNQFVKNNIYIDDKDNSMLLITGPNMAGKSTYMRQTAIIIIMAQIGCFIPASRGVIGIVDRIFTRIGASDNLAQGESTFFVEMSQLAYILKMSTKKSLIILDEIGRGTSTYDGLSIAWALVEYLCMDQNRRRTLFASHYHELTTLETKLKGFKNLNVKVTENNGSIVFLHKIENGMAEGSYGIEVAKLAGIDKEILQNANLKLRELEKKESVNISGIDVLQESEQLSLFDNNKNREIEDLIRDIDINELTPSKAISVFEDLKRCLDD